MNNLTKEQLAAIKARADAASPGPWTTERGEYSGKNWALGFSSYKGDDITVSITTDCIHASEMYGDAATDGEFIAYARTDIPALLKAIDARDAELAQLHARLAALEPLAQAAVALGLTPNSGRAAGELRRAAESYARAQAQDGAA